MKRNIPFKKLPLGKEEIKAVTEILKCGDLGSGKRVAIFEKMFAKYIGSKYAVAVDSCTSGLFLSLYYRAHVHRAFIQSPYVKIPSMTVPLVGNTIIHAGLQPYFIDEHEWVGHNYEFGGWNIIDSAHKVKRNDYKNFNDETLMCFSFYPTKPISSCEGGVIATNDEKAVEWLIKARYYGRNSKNTLCKNSWEYDIEFAGWKMNMTEIQAAICIEQLKKLPQLDIERKRVVKLYNKLLGLENTSLYLYRIIVPDRDNFIKYMKDNGVECGVHFKPLHLMTPFVRYEKGSMFNTEDNAKHTVSLPLYDSLENSDVEYIADLIKGWKR